MFVAPAAARRPLREDHELAFAARPSPANGRGGRGCGLAGGLAGLEAAPPAIAALKPMTEGMQPIAVDERRARIARAQRLMADGGLDAVVLASGTNLGYFTGAEWGLSERFSSASSSPREGEPAWVTPAFREAGERWSRSRSVVTCGRGKSTNRLPRYWLPS